MNDDPANWPTAMNNNARDYLAMKGSHNILGNGFPRNGKGLCFSKFHCKRKILNGESVEDLGLYTLSLLIEFIAFIANFS